MHKFALIGVAIAAVVVVVIALMFVPSGNYDVHVNVTSQEVSLVVTTYYSITGVSPTGSSPASIIDLNSAGISFAPPAIEAQFSMTVCASNSAHSICASKGASQWFPSVPFVNGATLTATNSFTLAQVPPGSYSLSVTLYQSGSAVASGSGCVVVPSGGC